MKEIKAALETLRLYIEKYGNHWAKGKIKKTKADEILNIATQQLAELEQSQETLKAIELAFEKGYEIEKIEGNWFVKKINYEPSPSSFGGRYAHVNAIPIVEWRKDQLEQEGK